jgi:uncharacterized protein with PhoU and TrkA domain
VVSFLDVMVRDKDATLRIEEVPVPAGSRWCGKRVGELELSRHRILLLAVKAPGGGGYLYAPGAEHRLEGGETLIVLGEPERARALGSEAVASR